MKSILVPVLGGINDLAALEAANAVARSFDSHIAALHVKPNVVQQGINMTLGVGGSTDGFWDVLAAEIKQNAAAARQNFDTFCGKSHLHVANTPDFVRGATAAWLETEGLLGETVIRVSRYHDLAILARPEGYFGFMPGDAGDVLMRSGRPILLVPAKLQQPTFKTVCVAWKDTSEAAHAVTAAMPLLEKASKVILVGVVEEEKKDDVTASLNALANSFRWRSIEPEIACFATHSQSATLELRDFARKAGADLLVMGAYGHSRAREFFFGGMTTEILESCEMPVLLMH